MNLTTTEVRQNHNFNIAILRVVALDRVTDPHSFNPDPDPDTAF
jgi:hypothetical protein